jgi:nucleoside-diphosphate-sugar epimerase
MIIVLGLGFTGQRLAWRLLRRGLPVCAAVRGIERFRKLADAGLYLYQFGTAPALPKDSILVDLIPPLQEAENAALRRYIQDLEPSRVLYVSSTGVYGDQTEVNEETLAMPSDERGRLRLAEEQWVSSGPWSSLILRAAAIYGPGRGVHTAIRQGRAPRGTASGVVSRIHVNDLAALIEVGISSDLEGAWPVADDEPCSTAEIAEWLGKIHEIQGNDSRSTVTTHGRRVDGRKIRELLALELTYRSWRTGIPASIDEEKLEESCAAY